MYQEILAISEMKTGRTFPGSFAVAFSLVTTARARLDDP